MISSKNIWFPLVFLIIASLFFSCSYFTYDSSSTNNEVKLFKANHRLDNKGKHITSKDELRTLIISVVFKDDTIKESESWKFDTTKLPSWSQILLNNSNIIEFPHQNLTHYFYEMSDGNFMLYGDIYPQVVVPKHDQSHYKSIGEVNSEILSTVDNEIDFSKYDNWSKQNNRYVNSPDGKVDMIFILYRNFENQLFFNKGWTGIAHLYLNDDFKTNDGVVIGTGRLDKGSGIQLRGGFNGYEYIKYILAHEFGHFLFGAFHIENVTNLALMTGGPVWNASRGMHSWERNKLSWMQYNDIPLGENTEIELDDYITTGEAARIKLSENEWYVIENHQQISCHDWAKSKGIYVYHVENANGFYPKISVKCSDGNWDFKIDEKNEKLIKTIPNRFGKNEMNFGRKFKGKSYAAYNQVYIDNSAWGDEYDAFNLIYNNLISPVSNPPADNNKNIEFAIEIIEVKNSKYLLKILFNNIYKFTPPSKPQLIEIFKDKNDSLYLSWLKNEEPDIVGYNLYFKSMISYVRSVYIPSTITKTLLDKYLQPTIDNIIWLTAVDKDDKESIQSDYFKITFNSKQNNWEWLRKEKL